MKRGFIGAVAFGAAIAFALPAMAIDFNAYGSVKVGTFWTQNQYYNTAGDKRSDSDFSLDLMGDSLVGVRAKEGDFSAVAELGAYNPKAYSKGLELRLLFAEWDFGNGKLRIGKTPSPYVYRTQQVWDSDGGMNAYGSLWDGRYANIKLTMNNGFYFTLMQPRVGASSNNSSNVTSSDATAAYSQTGNLYASTYTNYNTIMPKIVTGYEGKLDNWTYGGGVAYNMYNIETVSTANATPVKTDIHSYLVFFHGKVDLAPVELSYNVFTGRNTGDLMSSANTAYVAVPSSTSTGGYYDTFNGVDAYTYGGWGQVGYTVNKKLNLYAGASYVVDDNRVTHADERLATFINAQYQVSKNFKIVPEIDFINDMTKTSGAKEPRTFVAGAKWEMRF
ncbi:hypothetical protein [Geobacter sp. AOG2]|uniref:hypothetical protein n=1 Tax=Geobacter sp. AOG2 TaxID=1566347 RepID=UPI001CC7D6EE|nr:hypothetical protein [Geobacter sp. AOG2]GFE62065.1 hypothetical protein AOG2_26530 [Geobacter sp. AOG2]